MSECVAGLADGLIDGCLVGDVESGDDDLAGILGVEVFEDFGFTGGGDDVVALLEEFFGEDASESYGCAGDEPCFCGHVDLRIREAVMGSPLRFI